MLIELFRTSQPYLTTMSRKVPREKIMKAESLKGKYNKESHPEVGLDLDMLD